MSTLLGLLPYGGLQFVEQPWLSINEQVKFPRSKRKRIRKKWRKNPKYWRKRPDPSVYRMGNMIVGHPIMIRRIKRELEGKP